MGLFEVFFSLIVGFICFILGSILKIGFPAYISKKFDNIATKEDLARLTEIPEKIKFEFQKEFDDYTRSNTFQNDFYYKRYTELYAPLYSIVCQSEGLRVFSEDIKNKEYSFDEFPFLEICKKRNHTKTDLFTQQVVLREEIMVEDELTKFNKKELGQFIIDHEELASPKLIKLAIFYRYVNENYGGSEKKVEEAYIEYFNKKELQLIREIVSQIVKEYNQLRKDLTLDYDQHELETGKFNNEIYKV